MLSHLRFHRRGPSNPASPAGEQQPSPLSNTNSPFTPDGVSSPDTLPPTSTTSLVAPSLPPITRVTSDQSPPLPDYSPETYAPSIEQRMPQPTRLPYAHHDSGFIGGVALANYRRDLQAQKALVTPESATAPPVDDQQLRAKPSPAASLHSAASRSNGPSQGFSKVSPQSSVSPSDGFNTSSQPTGRRPQGWGVHSEPAPPSSVTITPMEPHKGKKGLPFLKNPMSTLLMRRRLNQNIPEALPPPVPAKDPEPAYDPRIKGTRVHDFSAPRRRSIPRNDLSPALPPPSVSDHQEAPVAEPMSDFTNQHVPVRQSQEAESPPAASSSNMRNGSFRDRMRSSSGSSMSGPMQYDNLSSIAESNATRGSASFRRANPSARTTRSRKISLSEMSSKDTLGSLPRHMKSTSSRFSFDMIGAAKQERIMEERHRQRQLEKGEPEHDERRDSRFDEFDDDGFDYDAMIDDDGLEERIPGVNADFDEEEEYFEEEIPYTQQDQYDTQGDPDNDQENFAGFVFQRSDPSSSLASPYTPGQMPTPRDAQGQAIGSAMTKDTPTLATFPVSAQSTVSDMDPAFTQQLARLEINEHEPLQEEMAIDTMAHTLSSVQQDELYFDDGIIGYEDEFAEDLAAEFDPNAEPFDESIFDDNDTDKYGRPVPGAFAQAQSLRRAASQSNKRESGMTSRFSGQSGISESTAHTSVSVAMPEGVHNSTSMISPPARGSSLAGVSPSQRKMAAYQAALAAAAHEAAASGKFQRSASPVQEEEVEYEDDYETEDMDEYETQESTIRIQDEVEYAPSVEEYDDFSYENMDDFELDDDAIIAEANASALANDSDGWYGQEFGFYSAPANQQHGSYSSSVSSGADYLYSNGGFFGPKGDLARTASGRQISREPNLTPITERSEYSNRNSIMSMGLPPIVGGTPTMQSPGLAQLAMMAEEGDDMTLSALLRLRSKAWGGSQASLSSSREGSPKSERGELPSSPWAASAAVMGGSGPMPGHSHVRKNSVLSIEGCESDLGSLPESPPNNNTSGLGPQSQASTLAVIQQGNGSNPVRGHSAPSAYPAARPHGSQSESAPVSAVQGATNAHEWTWSQDVANMPARAVSLSRHGMGHRRQKSSTESVSYIMEEEADGEARWIMERIRTGDDNETELLEREIIAGGRI